MILHSPIISGSLTFADGGTFTLPDNGVYSGSFSGSVAGIGDPTAFSASLDSRLDYLETDTGSQDNRIDVLEAFSGSINTTIKTKLNQEAVVSGSSQVSYANLSNIPAGIVSGSEQVTISSTTGYSAFSSSLDSRISTEKGRVDAILSAADADKDSFAEIVTLINSVDTTNDNAFASFYTASNATNDAQSARLTSLESATGSYETIGRGIVSGSSQVTISSTTGYTSFSSSLDSRISTEKGRVDAILSASTADADTFAEIVTLINSVDTTNDSAFASFYTSSNATNSAQDARLSALETKTGSLDSANTAQNSRLTSLESATGSYETIGRGIVSGSSQVTYSGLSSIPAGIVSGSSQVTTLLPTGTISGSSQVVLSSTTGFGNIATTYEPIASGTHTLVSGSSQINLASVTGNSTSNVTEGSNLYYTDARVKTKLTAEGVISGSVQVLGGTGIVSGSSQITYASISSIPAGIVSGSAQVTPLLPTGVVSGSVQVLGGTGIVSGSSQVTLASTTGFGTYINQALLTTSDVTHNNVTVSGNLIVNGTTTTVNSTTVQLGDNIIELNGSGAANGGLLVKDATAPNTTSGSLLWDSTNDYWKAGAAGSELPLVTTSGTQTLTNKTIDGSQLVNASVANAKLANSTISGIALGSNLATLTIGTGLSGTSYNGSGAVTIANTGVTSAVAGTGVSVSGATGAVTISIGQAVATSSNVQFNSLGIGMAASAVAGEIKASADIIAYASSDERLKENIKPIENALDKISKISGNTFDWKSGYEEIHSHEGNDVGLIAQEIEAVLPQLVTTREHGFKAVQYDKLVALLVEGIKEQQKQIDELKSKLK
jgi:ribosome-binding factor A